jgi:hypothetical protein
MQRKAWAPGLVLLLAVAACGDDDDDDGTGGSPSDGSPGADAAAGSDAGSAGDGAPGADGGRYSVQLVSPSCGPADQAAVAILLGEPTGGSCAVDDSAPSVRLEVWTREITAPAMFSFAPGEALGGGQLCPGGERPCLSYATGDISFDTYDETSGATGSWRLIDEAGTVTGSFDATWCDPDPPRPCG